MNGIVNFENLALIPQLLEKVIQLQNEVTELKTINSKLTNIEKTITPQLDLSKRADVRKYLNISESTLVNMMNDGRLKEGIHFKREFNGNKTKISFVESAIVKIKVEK